jgi:hypothetical protein
MGLPAFNTLEVFDSLGKAGFSEEQARAISATVLKAQESSDVATKADIAGLRSEIKQDISALRNDMERDIAEVRHEISDVRKDMQAMEERSNSRFNDVLKEIQLARAWTTVSLGGIVIACTAAFATLQHLHWL